MSKTIKAIPTKYGGVQYKSRLEARFAEMLTNAEVEFYYEVPFPGSQQGYTPDFYLPAYRLYIEVKPKDLLDELDIFRSELMASTHPWICVDNSDRGKWRVIDGNPSSHQGATFGGTEIIFLSDRMRFHVTRVDFFPAEDARPSPEPEPELPTSLEVQRMYFEQARRLLSQ